MPAGHPIDPLHYYARLQTRFLAEQDEALLDSIADIGRMMAVAGLPVDEVLDVHCAELTRAVVEADPAASAADLIRGSVACLSELLVAWRVAAEGVGVEAADDPTRGAPLFLRFDRAGRVLPEDWAGADTSAAGLRVDADQVPTLGDLMTQLVRPAPHPDLDAALRERRILSLDCRPTAAGRRFRLVLCPFLRGDGIVALHDVTARLAVVEAERQKAKLESLGQLAGGIAHEINNLLQPVLICGRFILEDHPDDPELCANARAIVDSAATAAEVVRGVLAFSRRTSARRDAVALGPAVAAELERLRPTLPAEVTLDADLAAAEGRAILANPSELAQILHNLVGNAVDATDRRGRVAVGLAPVTVDEALAVRLLLPAGGYLRLSVADDGPGIDPAVARRIFDPFFTTKEIGRGTGLGLSIVRGIVESWKGAIVLREGGGPGTVFDLYFPLVEPPPPPTAAAALARPALAGRQALVVDDDARVRAGLARLLERAGLVVRQAGGADEALAELAAAPADLVLVDLMMPDVDGFTLIALLRARDPGLAILALSGVSDPEARGRAEQAGANAFRSKPVSGESLVETVAMLLGDGQNDDGPDVLPHP